MKICLSLLLVLTLPSMSVYAICNMPRPVFPESIKPGSRTPKDAYPSNPDPTDPDPTDPPLTEPPTTDPVSPGPGGPPTPGGTSPGAGGTPPARGPAGGPTSPGRGRRGSSNAGSWYLWWELNRENLLGLRTAMRGHEVVSGDADPVAAYRDEVRAALRNAFEKPMQDSVRASVLRALGRAGTDHDAKLFLALLKAKGTKATVREGAAIGLGLLPAIQDPTIRDEVRAFATGLMEGRTELRDRTRQVALMAIGLRARRDPFLTAGLARMARRPAGGANETAALLFALGLTREPMLGRELTVAARDGKLAGRPQHDVSRSHAAIALAMSGNPIAVDVYSRILVGSEAQAHTRRSAAIGMGIVLRKQQLPDQTREVAERVLLRVLTDDRDPLVSSFAAVGLGYARKPAAIRALIRTAGRAGGTVEGPYAVLALGLAARRLPEAQANKVRRFLAGEYESCRDQERSGALAIAVGIAGATEARDLLIRRVVTTTAPLRVRALAAQALGVLGDRSKTVEDVLRKALDDGAPLITENAAIALGMLGHRQTAALLVKKLKETRSKALQTHMMVALAHLGGTPAIAPLVEIIKSGRHDDRVLDCAVTVLGILADPRDEDALFEIDASVNVYGLTVASRCLVQPY